MTHEIEGQFRKEPARFGIVVSKFNEIITKNLLSGALEALHKFGYSPREDVQVVWVPGAFEIPFAAKQMAQGGSFDALVCLGCVIRGATSHFDYVAGPTASSIQSLSLEFNIPIGFGLLTCDTLEQALERSGSKAGNKGIDAALAALDMLSVKNQIERKLASTPVYS